MGIVLVLELYLSCIIQVLSCGDNVLFCGLVHQEDVAHFPPELTDPDILADIVNFTPNKKAKVCFSEDADGNLCLEPPVEEFMLTQIKVLQGLIRLTQECVFLCR